MQSKIDLKLLKIINVLVVSGSVTKAAQLLNLSPGAVSYSLKKLRSLTGEHLFIRTKAGMKPDATALELSQRYQKFCSLAHENNADTIEVSREKLTVMTFSPMEMLLAESIFNLPTDSSLYRYVFLPYTASIDERADKLKSGIVDVDIGGKLPADKLISKVKILSCDVVALSGVQNKALPTQLSVDDLYRARHAIWNVMIDYYCHSIRNAQKVGKYIQSRDVGLISSSIINMVTFCAHSDSIMLIPEMFVPMLTKKFPVQCHKLPAEFDMKYDCYMHFNTQITEDEQAMKFVDNVISNVRDLCLSP
ncbi:LysR family transcriptional regulator [Buttiauxella agrestis]|uniref:LysR family transcriptional regulator n=1 Tax=Buttiauxella agrestis TaxID=82977 RepID=UPI00155F83B5|nr:LysR family transcriptional regulator [Buttiauxella agrestis]BCG09214.1 LysR family transcriptional regulator [Buttiauxella agrestis]